MGLVRVVIIVMFLQAASQLLNAIISIIGGRIFRLVTGVT